MSVSCDANVTVCEIQSEGQVMQDHWTSEEEEEVEEEEEEKWRKSLLSTKYAFLMFFKD